jgi:myo-inositol-1(or 4)-monophosphatase
LTISDNTTAVATAGEGRRQETIADHPLPDAGTLRAIEEAACEFIRDAGKIVLERYAGPLEIEYKDKLKRDPVTEADKAVEAYLTEAVGARFPEHRVLGEEGQDPAHEAEYEWIVDPIDGTVNFINHLPFFAVSVGVLHRRRPVVGAILFPTSGDLLHARHGGGAYQNDTPIRVHPATEPSNRITAGLPPGYWFQFRTERPARRKLGEARSLGSIAYEMGVVATGGFGWAIFRGPKVWDVAGGVTIVREAGGVVLYHNQDRGGWVPLDRFIAPLPKNPDEPRKLRNWGAPVILGAKGIAEGLAPHLSPRRKPLAVTGAIARYRGWRRWLPKKQPQPSPEGEPLPAAKTSKQP